MALIISEEQKMLKESAAELLKIKSEGSWSNESTILSKDFKESNS